MFITKKALPRRTFLRGMGVTVALPLLDAMVPAATVLAQTPARPVRRFGAVYVPHGLLYSQWVPATAGPGFEFSPILKPLEPFRDRLTVISNLSAGPTVQNGGPRSHRRRICQATCSPSRPRTRTCAARSPSIR